jgi:hypothetical protein
MLEKTASLGTINVVTENHRGSKFLALNCRASAAGNLKFQPVRVMPVIPRRAGQCNLRRPNTSNGTYATRRSAPAHRRPKKQTQANPFELSFYFSDAYARIGKSKPIEVKLNSFCRLRRKVGLILQFLDDFRPQRIFVAFGGSNGQGGTAPFQGIFSPRKLAGLRVKAGISCRMIQQTLRAPLPSINWSQPLIWPRGWVNSVIPSDGTPRPGLTLRGVPHKLTNSAHVHCETGPFSLIAKVHFAGTFTVGCGRVEEDFEEGSKCGCVLSCPWLPS